MKGKKFLAMILSAALGMSTFAACGRRVVEPEKKTTETEAETETEETENSEEVTEETETENVDEDDIFAQLAGESFMFTSGAGAWDSTLILSEDGSFVGNYHDADAGDSGDGYPNGTLYYCDFYGKFIQPEKINDYTYEMQLENIAMKETEGDTEIKGGVKYIYTGPAGLEEVYDLYIYLPGAPLDELPERFLDWASIGLTDEDTTLPFYAIFNTLTFDTFLGPSGDKVTVNDKTTTSDVSIESELQKIEEKAAAMQEDLSSGELTQQEMNTLSLQLYQLWDNELNSIWSRLKETLDEDTMTTLTQEERDWIKTKDSAVEEAGKDAEGGSLQPLLENDKAAELTRNRVYELAEYLK